MKIHKFLSETLISLYVIKCWVEKVRLIKYTKITYQILTLMKKRINTLLDYIKGLNKAISKTII